MALLCGVSPRPGRPLTARVCNLRDAGGGGAGAVPPLSGAGDRHGACSLPVHGTGPLRPAPAEVRRLALGRRSTGAGHGRSVHELGRSPHLGAALGEAPRGTRVRPGRGARGDRGTQDRDPEATASRSNQGHRPPDRAARRGAPIRHAGRVPGRGSRPASHPPRRRRPHDRRHRRRVRAGSARGGRR
jgi:hypothetical protein